MLLKELVKKLLLEHIPLRGICRVLRVSLPWLLSFTVELYERLPDDLNVEEVASTDRVRLLRLEAEADETWSFVGTKANKQWNRNRTRHPNQASARLLCWRSQPAQR